MANLERPLSPHLQVYRWPLAMAISILHRITGVALAIGALLLVVILIAVATGPEAYEATHSVLIDNKIAKAFLFLWTIALFLHLFNGIRHLFWDAGYGFEKSTTFNSGIVVLVVTVLLSTAVWVVAYLL